MAAPPVPRTFTSAITITLGEVAENHIGNQQIGNTKVDHGFSLEDLKEFEKYFQALDDTADIEIVNLKQYVNKSNWHTAADAYVLVIRNGVNILLAEDGQTADDMFDEQDVLVKDTKYFDTRRKKVLNKLARHNLCFDTNGQTADYETGKGTIIPFGSVPCTQKVRDSMSELLDQNGYDGSLIKGEGNYYYDLKKCGIGFHGDAERRWVIGVRLGASIPLHYQWYYDSEEVGRRCVLELNHGDIYIMSDKAVGYDWKRRIIPTLRHAAGADKYLKLLKPITGNNNANGSGASASTSSTKVKNPKTKRMIVVGKGVYKALMKEGYVLVDGELVKE